MSDNDWKNLPTWREAKEKGFPLYRATNDSYMEKVKKGGNTFSSQRLGGKGCCLICSFLLFFFLSFLCQNVAIFGAIFVCCENRKSCSYDIHVWFCFQDLDPRQKRSTSSNSSLSEYKIGEDLACPQLDRKVHCNGPLDPGTQYMYVHHN